MSVTEYAEWSEAEPTAAPASGAVTTADAADAARLVAFGLQPKLQPPETRSTRTCCAATARTRRSRGSPTPWPQASG